MEVRVGPVPGKPLLEVSIAIDHATLRVAHTHLGVRARLAGWLSSGPAGGPGWPTKTIGVALPPGHQARELHVDGVEQVKVTKGPTPLAPLPPPRRDVPEGAPSELRMSKRVPKLFLRSKGSVAPLVRLLETRWIGETPIALLQLSPLSFDKHQGLALATRLRVLVHLEPVRKAIASGPCFSSSETQRTRLAELARASVVNPAHVIESAPTPRIQRSLTAATCDYVIITDNLTWNAAAKTPTGAVPGMVDTFRQLATWKNGLGFLARVVTINEIVQSRVGAGLGADFITGASDLQAVLRKFIAWACASWGTAYVLLGGDTNIVPIRHIANGSGWHPVLPTDFYYADLDPSCEWAEQQKVALRSVNYRCDLSVARAPVANQAQAQTFVNKVMAYESLQIDRDPKTPVWLRRVLYASCKWGGDDPSVIQRVPIHPPPPDCYCVLPAASCSLIHLQDTVAIQKDANQGNSSWASNSSGPRPISRPEGHHAYSRQGQGPAFPLRTRARVPAAPHPHRTQSAQ